MNSILHTCTHSNDDTLTRLSDDQMYAAIFQYIEHLFEIIKPKETFYMAIDGVAPRAKMNQQRARRFRTAYEAEENLKKAIDQGLEIPKEDPFDSNSITPGTEFMAKLTDNLKYFIHKKISEDSNWSNVKIILSGHEVPGEGEHKIMDYIRTMKNQPNYNSNLRHCIYGLDADLIMLGLVSHDPHFALLREEVTFGPRSKSKSTDLNDQNFYLLHISLLREYMSLEFQDLDTQISFEYSFEKVLDDFILIMYVIGNDFLPNLPDLFINKGAFPLLIETFKQSMKDMDGYLNENGTINLKRLRIWLKYLSEFELENFEKADVDVEWFNKRLEDISITGEKKREKTGKLLILKEEKKLVGFIKPWLMNLINRRVPELLKLEAEGNLKNLPLNSYPTDFIEKHFEFLKKFCEELGLLIVHSQKDNNYSLKFDLDGINPHETDEEFEERVNLTKRIFKEYQSANLFETDEVVQESKDIYNKKFMDWKDSYYKEKLHFSIYDKDAMIEMTKHYVEGLQWVLYYYYKGCPSWNWYYKYHYAPRISDILIGLDDYIAKEEKIQFVKSKPFKPFEQLMAVLPARSKSLMPLVYRSLMTDPQSPIIDFYPHEVDIDLNGKTASWEAVVLLSFVDEEKLLEVLKPIEAKLTSGELKRNSFGTDILFIYNPQFDQIYPTPLPGYFNEIEHDKCIEEPFVLPKVEGEVKIELPEDAKTGKDLLAGFPTLTTLPFTSELVLNETKVFQNASRSESMVLTLRNIWEDYSSKQFMEKFLGELVYSRWPYLRESKILEINDGEFKYEFQNGKKFTTELELNDRRDYEKIISNINYNYLKTKAIKIDSSVFVRVVPVNGLIRNKQGAYVKTFSKVDEIYPIELIVEEVVNHDERYVPRPPKPIDEEFPLNSQAIFLGAFGYGSPSLIVGYTPDQMKLNIKVHKIALEDDIYIGKQRQEIEKKEIKYYPSFEVCKQIKISPLFLSRLTSGFMIEDDVGPQKRKINVGLELKFEGKRLKVLGYTEKTGNYWQYSPWAVKLITDYKDKFPSIFKKMMEVDSKGIPKLSDLKISVAEINKLRDWLKEVKGNLLQVNLETESLTKFSFAAIEKELIDSINSGKGNKFSNKDIKGVPKEAVLRPNESYQLLNTQLFELGDRVVYVQDFGKVPYLSKGTVASINPIGTKIELGIIFDYPLMSGNTMNGKLKTNRGLVIESSFVLNLTNKQLIYHSKASKNKPVINNSNKMINKINQLHSNNMIENSHKHEILNLINSKVKPNEIKEDGNTNTQAIKQIYGQIYNNIMNEGTNGHGPPPGGMPMPMTMPMQVPTVPGVPIPPQFQQPSQPQQGYPQQTNGTNESSSNGRGRCNFRGRGASRGTPRGGASNRGGATRGSSRGNDRGRGRGSDRARGRGRGRGEAKGESS